MSNRNRHSEATAVNRNRHGKAAAANSDRHGELIIYAGIGKNGYDVRRYICKSICYKDVIVKPQQRLALHVVSRLWPSPGSTMAKSTSDDRF